MTEPRPQRRAWVARPRIGRRRVADVLVALTLTVVWAALMRSFGDGNVYERMGPYALFVLAVVLGLDAATWKQRLHAKTSGKALAVGLVVGVTTTVLTYPVYDGALALFPSLDVHVQDLYQDAHRAPFLERMAWVVVLIAAEEVLFRDWMLRLFDVPARWIGPAACVVIYAAAQAGAGSWIVVAMALTMGAIWMTLRCMTQSLAAPWLAHMLWTPIVLLIRPVAAG